MRLPEEFCHRMQDLLKEEFPLFLAEYEKAAFRGVRLNPLKASEEVLQNCYPHKLTPTRFSPLSFYTVADKPGSYAAHHAGIFYAQEPSASCAVTVLAPEPGDKVLDLCAAPGGKSTQIAALTGDCGLLVANEIVRNRALALSSNLERIGVRNVIVTSARPDVLCSVLPLYFDKILVDAPCSGEGMFRHDPNAIREWTKTSPTACAARQKEILDSAAEALRPGGILVYSTCTFSEEENERTVLSFLARHPEFEAIPTGVSFGRSCLDGCAVRIYPMDGGEGHFAAKLRKKLPINDFYDEESVSKMKTEPLSPELYAFVKELHNACFTDSLPETFYSPRGSDIIYAIPNDIPQLPKAAILRIGYEFAKICGKRLEPCHSAFLVRNGRDCRQAITFEHDDPLLAAFLRGEEIPCDSSLQGYVAVLLQTVPCGFGKASGGRLKNKYPKGLRNHK